jgi:hypothetical protein
MPDLFGLDIAGILNDAIQSAGGLRSATLTKTVNGTRTPGSLTGGNNATSTSHTCQAYVESSSARREGSLTRVGGTKVGILGASISPAAVPQANDRVTVDGVDYTIVGVPEIDPAQALFICSVES